MKKNHIFCLCHQEKIFNNTPILLYTTGASCGGRQLISTVGFFHISPFETVAQGDMVHCKRIFSPFVLHSATPTESLIKQPLLKV
jgi:hypothetical protein